MSHLIRKGFSSKIKIVFHLKACCFPTQCRPSVSIMCCNFVEYFVSQDREWDDCKKNFVISWEQRNSCHKPQYEQRYGQHNNLFNYYTTVLHWCFQRAMCCSKFSMNKYFLQILQAWTLFLQMKNVSFNKERFQF